MLDFGIHHILSSNYKKLGLFTADFISQPQSMELDNCSGQPKPKVYERGTCFQHVLEFYEFTTDTYSQEKRAVAKFLSSLQQITE